MIKQINSTALKREEVLENHAYLYDRERKLCIREKTSYVGCPNGHPTYDRVDKLYFSDKNRLCKEKMIK